MYKNLKFIIIFVWIFVFSPLPAQCAVSLSVSPIHGGSTLQFDRAEVLSESGREVRVRVTATEGQQYQVFQRWVQPLMSSTGGLPGRDVLRFYGLSGSNGSGTLYGNVPEYIGMSDQLVYSSSSNGMSDNFILVYNVDPDRLNATGQLMGRLVLTVRAIGSGSAQDVFLDVLIDANLGFKMSVRGEKSAQMIRLDAQNENTARDQVNFSFQGNAGLIRVYQEVLLPVVSQADQSELPRGAIQYESFGQASDSSRFSSKNDLDFNRTLIYESSLQEDEWTVNYELLPSRFAPLKAGMYQGRVRYSIESSSMRNQVDFNIEVDVAPVFEISFEFPDGPVNFSKVLPGAGPQERTVTVKVNTNLQKPYSVSQKVMDSMRNQQGESFDHEYFLIKTSANDAALGEVRMPEFMPVSTDVDQTLFVSDRQGSPAEFTVFYRLIPYDDMSPGNYWTEIAYSLGQI